MRKFNCLNVEYYKEHEVLLWKIKDTGMPNFCLKGLLEFKEFAIWVRDYFSHPERPVKFIVSASEHDGVYNMGGDLPFFVESIKSCNKTALTQYAHLCIDAIYEIYTSFGLQALTIAMVEGNAYGGGFECALSHDIIIAERKAKFCLPENKFNLFPGMGAYSLLYRKLNTKDANTVLKAGKIYQAEELYDLGCIDKLSNKNKSIQTLFSYITKTRERYNFEYHHNVCKKKIFPLDKAELIDITDIWVDACMKVELFDIRRMEILAKAQYRKTKVVL
ncbi:crotonase/enoyl-CoA hydratase family protein [Aquimarina sp. AU119]|uniref:crotonase/enoyl-CoA hydratase family protein n=1 Tax=Aquimarina sp. AU119 TaxID=2108528 RepID=UPI000D689CBE|nr:crotonase/enoyl-CoA hydratase family protein [Aquimarina sp. AU119]